MSDDETRREEGRIEAAIDRALRNGTWGLCWYCRDATSHKDEDGRWLCRPCARMMDEPQEDTP